MLGDVQALLENLEIGSNVEPCGGDEFDLWLEYKGWSFIALASYVPETGVLTLGHNIEHQNLKTLQEAVDICARYGATPGRYVFANAWMCEDVPKKRVNPAITCDVTVYIPLDMSPAFLAEYLKVSIGRFCFDCADLYRAVYGDPTVFRDPSEVGNA